MCTFFSSLLMICLSGPLKMFACNEDSLSKYDRLDPADSIVASFTYHAGEQVLPGGTLLQVPHGYRFLDAAQSKVLVARLWGNRENPDMVGMLLPDGVGPMDEDVWGFEVSFESTGYVSEKGLSDINYDELLRRMKQALKEDNKLLIQQGLGPVTGINWAFAPYYDKEARALHWPRVLEFDEGRQAMLNYEIRVPGRKGVLCFTAVGDISQLPVIRRQIPIILNSIHFMKGYSYGDFNPHTDQFAMLVPEAVMVGRIFSPQNFWIFLRNSWLLLLVSCGMALFVYAMQLYHHRRRSIRNVMRIDESLN
ncbi:DUF2167 domain-containing protein [Chitinophaga vietnamensis]|uniref:DUF2167 domain-containing protein n=1 Tax=Chitinophaga vietnamensis TaxID=2593957 RepID=UPI001177B987|nr:DUF2167 domain-containing protein [Chitinophaga vietnamensis]